MKFTQSRLPHMQFLRHLLVACFAIIYCAQSQAGDAPDSIVGKWTMKSVAANGKEIEPFQAEQKPGAVWRFFDDGTGKLVDKKMKWSYDKAKGSLTIETEGVFYGYNVYIANGDISSEGTDLVIKATALNTTVTWTLKPSEK